MFKVKTFLKGLLMGTCDIIPGISAGTIAFITGIYERLIDAIKSFSFHLLFNFFLVLIGKGDKFQLKRDVRKLDLSFLLSLLAGILVAIFFLAGLMLYLLDNYFAYTMAFFVGLILASANTIFKHIEKHQTANVLIALVGAAIGVSLVFIIPASVDPGFLYVLFGGFLAVSAMLLPGVSGSFVLLVLGIYGFMLNVVKDIFNNLGFALIFVLGAILGLIVMSRIISYLFHRNKSATLYFLLGLVVGSLSVPLKGIYFDITVFSFGNTLVLVGLFFLGIIAASTVSRLSTGKKSYKN